MPAQKPTKPATSARLVHRQTLDDPSRACQVLDRGLDDLESKVGQLQKLMTKEPPTVTGSTALAIAKSLTAALASLGLVKDATT